MNKEIGKWFLDVAKYIVTAFLLTRMFVKIDTFFTIFCALLTVVAFFALGIYFLDKDKTNDNNKKGD